MQSSRQGMWKGIPFVDRRYTNVVPVFLKKASPYKNSLSTPLPPPGLISRLLSGYIAIPSVKKYKILSSHSVRVTSIYKIRAAYRYMFQRMITAPSTAHAFSYKVHLLYAPLFINKALIFPTSCILASADCFIVQNRLITWQGLIKIW